jgi:RHS repeat-associated protein
LGLRYNSYARGNSLTNKSKLFQGQEHIDDLGLNWDSFRYRNHQPDIGRFFSVDPLADEYVYNSPYAFAENKLGLGIELEGLELLPLAATYTFEVTTSTTRPTIFFENPIKATTETTTKLGEVGAKTSETSGTTGKSSMAENFARGKKVEAEQLAKNGLEKNTKPIEGTEGRSIPDAIKKDGGTSEIKNVKEQGLTKQLRIQKEVSNGNGAKPELIINRSAKLTDPLKKAGFDIKTYQNVAVPADATKSAPSPAEVKSKCSTCL